MSLNGMSLNGMSLNGTSLSGQTVVKVAAGGRSSTSTALNASGMNGATLTNPAVYVGSSWTGTSSGGLSVPLRIDTATRGAGATSDVGMYGVSYQSSSGWQPLCGVDGAGVKILAVAVLGTWNYGEDVVGGGAYTSSTTFQTFACRGKSIAKCVEMGYKPWSGRSTHLAACVRMLRGDYCGTGKGHTLDGTMVNLYDNVGIQADTAAWVKEAEWSENGARCVNTNGQPRFLLTATRAPRCLQGTTPTVPVTSTCGNTFGTGTLIINELQTDTNTWQ